MTISEIPRSINSKNIFLLIQEILSDQKIKGKKHDRALALAIVDRLNEQYQQDLDKWAEKSEELKTTLAEEYHELKESLNSTGGWFLGGLAIAGAVLGFIAGGPAGAVIGAALGSGSAGGGILGDHLASDGKLFFDSKKEIDQLKLKERELFILPISDEIQAIQIKADMKKGKISRTMQIDVETAQQIEIAMSNMIVALLKKFGETSNMMGRG